MRRSNSAMDLLSSTASMLRSHVIVFQKCYSQLDYYFLRLAVMLGKKTFVDIDDAPSQSVNPTTLKYFRLMCIKANAVFAGSENLFNYCKEMGATVHLIPSAIKLENYGLKESFASKDICLGWIGNGKHYKADLIAILEGPLTELSKNFDIKLKLIGSSYEAELQSVFGNIRNLQTEFIHSLDWSEHAAIDREMSDIDIGLYPLLTNEFNQYKCGFKALEYMAKGIVVVSSNVAMNQRIVEDGVSGYLVEGDDAWIAALKQLIQDQNLRIQMGKAGRKKVERDYDLNKVADHTLEIIMNG